MLGVQEYKIKIERIIDRLPVYKVEELVDYADFLSSRYPQKEKSGVDEESLFLQQESLKNIWDNPGEDIYDLPESVMESIDKKITTSLGLSSKKQ